MTLSDPTHATMGKRIELLRERSLVRHARLGTALFLSTVAISSLCWIQLVRHFSLARRYETDFFALEKLPGGFDSPLVRQTIWLFLMLGVAYALGLWLLHRMLRLGAGVRGGIVAAWLLPGICNVLLFPFGALDIFRYMIALKTYFFYHENPYVHGFMAHKYDTFAKHAFLLHLPNAKGPVWFWLSAIPANIAGFDDQQRMLYALKAFNLLLIGLIALMLFKATGGGKRGWIAIFLFGANPLVLFESVGVGHNDVMTAGLLVAALIALQRRSWSAAPLLVASALVKYFTFQLIPLFAVVMLARRWEVRRVALSAVASILLVIVVVAPFWSGGDMLDGIERVGEKYDVFPHVSLVSLERQWRIREAGDDHWAEIANRDELFTGLFIVLSLPVLFAAWKGASPARAATFIYLLFLLLVTLLYPWYLVPVVAIAGLTATRFDLLYVVPATTLGLLYYPFYVWAQFSSDLDMFGTHLYLAAFLTVPIVLYLLAWSGSEGWRLLRRRRESPRFGTQDAWESSRHA